MKFILAFFTSGLLLIIMGVAMLITGFLDYGQGHENASDFFVSSVICLFFGGSLYLINLGSLKSFNVRDGFLLTSISWLVLSIAGALPLWMSDLDLSFTDACFESLSGITTTGSTVLSGLDTMSHGILL